MTDNQIDEQDMLEIMRSFDSLFRVDEFTGHTMINRNRLQTGVMIYWSSGLTIMSENFHSVFVQEFLSRYEPDMELISDDNSPTTFSMCDCEIEMTLSSDYRGTETWFNFEIISYPNDTPCVSDDEE